MQLIRGALDSTRDFLMSDFSEIKKAKALREITRSRSRLFVCVFTLPVYILALWALLNNGRDIIGFMFFYMCLYAIFAINMASKRCPDCGKQFFVKVFLLNVITKNCVHCSLPYD
ncbi:MAG: hypothetical protein CMQ17_13530 [Gammaproteobacteria bacterium]|jgi:hypothetical protein|nr:hypothetical protein [Gammaproteobacteria bacterium]|tara:strand:+ start:757 stop:1101 length:345 start_codon:yes stop_codon:yes gene_type:complete